MFSHGSQFFALWTRLFSGNGWHRRPQNQPQFTCYCSLLGRRSKKYHSGENRTSKPKKVYDSMSAQVMNNIKPSRECWQQVIRPHTSNFPLQIHILLLLSHCLARLFHSSPLTVVKSPSTITILANSILLTQCWLQTCSLFCCHFACIAIGKLQVFGWEVIDTVWEVTGTVHARYREFPSHVGHWSI